MSLNEHIHRRDIFRSGEITISITNWSKSLASFFDFRVIGFVNVLAVQRRECAMSRDHNKSCQ